MFFWSPELLVVGLKEEDISGVTETSSVKRKNRSLQSKDHTRADRVKLPVKDDVKN